MSAQAVIQMENVTVRYSRNETPSLRDCSLSVAPGECVLVTGASGCGKTTLTRCLNGLIPHFHDCELTGEVTLAGRRVSDLNMHEIARLVGSVFQDPRSQFFTLHTETEIAFPSENFAVPTEDIQHRVQEVMEQLGIQRLLGRFLGNLSSGERQLVAIASAVALRPEVLVLDEPSANLGFSATEALRQALIALREQGTALVISEHKLYWLRDLCDTVYLMHEGRLTERLTGQAFFSQGEAFCREHGLRSTDPWRIRQAERQPTTATPLRAADCVCYAYRRGQPVLHQSSMHLAPGEITVLIGENGAGKSTLARLLVGLAEPHKGCIRHCGRGVRASKRRAESFYVMQDADYQLVAESVENELLLGNERQAGAAARATQLLERFSLHRYAEHHPATLSGGQKQRLTIALALMRDAQVLVFDEPTSGLDGANMLRVQQILQELAASGRAVMVISHDAEFVLGVADRILRIERGGELAELDITPAQQPKLLQWLLPLRYDAKTPAT